MQLLLSVELWQLYDIAHISSGRGLGRVENLHQALQVAQKEKSHKSEPRNRTCTVRLYQESQESGAVTFG